MASRSLVRALHEEGEAAQNIAAELFSIQDSVPEYAVTSKGVLGELFGISSALGDLKEVVLESRTLERLNQRVSSDLNLILPTLTHTLQEIGDVLDQQLIHRGPETEIHLRIWKTLDSRFRIPIGLSLLAQLGVYRGFLVEIAHFLAGQQGGFCDVALLREQIREIRVSQVNMASNASDSSSQSSQVYSDPLWSPGMTESPFSSPPDPSSPTTHAPPSRVPPPQAQTLRPESSHRINHWAPNVFDGCYSVTEFRTISERSKCYGPFDVGVEQIVGRSSWLLTTLEFDHRAVILSIYWSPITKVSRVLCVSNAQRSGPQAQMSIERIGCLKILREGSSLKLCKISSTGGRPVLWATLNFAIFERMILCFCTLGALKAQSHLEFPLRSKDFILDGEAELFSSNITDDGFLHTLRIFQDLLSKGVRLEASVTRGELKRSPVWTAFITQYIGAQAWVTRINPNTIHLRDLHPYIFSSNYTPQRGPRGEFELRFVERQATQSFRNTLASIKLN